VSPTCITGEKVRGATGIATSGGAKAEEATAEIASILFCCRLLSLRRQGVKVFCGLPLWALRR
jgi:hypothetical protein